MYEARSALAPTHLLFLHHPFTDHIKLLGAIYLRAIPLAIWPITVRRAVILTAAPGRIAAGTVRLRPLSVGGLTMISRAAREDASLVPLLMVKESLVEPALSLDQIRQMHIGLVQFLVSRINLISGLGADGESYEDALQSGIGQTHLLLAKHC